MRKALNEVTARDRELLWLAYALDMTHEEIADVSGVARGSVRVLLQRARRRFISVVEGYNRSDEAGAGDSGSGLEVER